jgi:cell division cycle 2-like protein
MLTGQLLAAKHSDDGDKTESDDDADKAKQQQQSAPVEDTKPEEQKMDDDIARLPIYYPGISGCRSVEEFQCINRIEEGTYGVVYRATEKRTGNHLFIIYLNACVSFLFSDEVVALKRLKMEKEKEGFPITSLREINMLLKAGSHPNIVRVRVRLYLLFVYLFYVCFRRLSSAVTWTKFILLWTTSSMI